MTGTVIDVDGEPLIGVNIVVKGTTAGTVTDVDGTYILGVANNDDVLVFSYIGYLSEEIPVGDKTVVNITLIEDTRVIDELVVVGYGVKKSYCNRISSYCTR